MSSRGVAVLPVVATVLGLGLAACGGPTGPVGPGAAAVPRSADPRPAPAPSAEGPAKAREIAMPAPVAAAAGRVSTLAPTRTASFAMLGVTWDRGADDDNVRAEVRVRRDAGWSAWERLEVDTDETEGGRAGTEPWWVDSADEVSARVTSSDGTAPSGIKVVTVDPGDDSADTATATPAFYSTGTGSAVVTVADGKPTYTARPSIITRSSWQAKRSNDCDDAPKYPRYGTTTEGVVLHHTAGANSYSRSKSASIVRGIQSFHMKGRGWCDIGYNFIVDKYGQTFMGRDGGADRQVRGSHAGNSEVNERTMGVALMGDLSKARPSTRMKDATVRLVGWRMGTTYLAAKGTYRIGGKELHRIAGHRNVVSTACPGKYGYAWLKAKGGLRDRVAAYTSRYSSAIRTASKMLTVSQKGVVVIGETSGATTRRMVWSKLDFYWKQGVGAFPVAGTARSPYDKAGGPTGVLGYPTSSMTSSATIPGIAAQRFERGGIWRVATTSSSTSYVITGATYDAYVANGEAEGPLGAPTSDVVRTGDTVRTTFAHGSIEVTDGQEPVVVVDGQPRRAPQPSQQPSEAPAPTTSEPTPGPTEAA
ncbi:MAG: N-acetylmuramoyl-L-alanine amidase [Aeromicrobium sp.]